MTKTTEETGLEDSKRSTESCVKNEIKNMDMQLAYFAQIIGGSPWGADKGKPRIYMRSRNDATSYFEFPDACYDDPDFGDDLGGAVMKIFIKDCGQHTNWYSSQRDTLAAGLWQHSLSLGALAKLEPNWDDLAKRIMALSDDAFTEKKVNAMSKDILNDRFQDVLKHLQLMEKDL